MREAETAASTTDLIAAVSSLPNGWLAHVRAIVGSTQDWARAAADDGAPSRSIFVADVQTAGRGRSGRSWQSEPGRGLLMSILLRSPETPSRPWQITASAALAVCEAIEEVAPGVQPRIKWPNDVLLDGLKVAGILADGVTHGEHGLMVVGVGVNVAGGPPPKLPATSVSAAATACIERGPVLSALVRRLDAWLRADASDVHQAWRARLWGRGQRLRLIDIEQLEVTVLDADLDGALRVRLADGSERRILTGELA